ncbi:cadherin-like domain-containing protein [Vibrio lentus]|nr:cadherin-like domain-containing protein [Vibrio lentus]
MKTCMPTTVLLPYQRWQLPRFTPEKDYNGDVQFTYNVKDGHGGVIGIQVQLHH